MIRAIVRKDLASTWASPAPYIVGATFQAVIGLLMVDQLAVRGQAVIQPLFPLAAFLLLLMVPALTMRSFAEEAETGTLDLLEVVPVPTTRMVLAKWLAGWTTSLVVLAPAVVFVVMVNLWGDPDHGPVVTGFLGLVLLAGAASAIGVLTSSCTESQPIAAMTAIFVSVAAWFAHLGDAAVGDGGLLAAVSFSERLRLFAGGAVDTGDVVFFAGVIVAALTIATTLIDLRRIR